MRLLPSSPNWYCSRSSDSSPGAASLGFGAKNSVFLLDISHPGARITGELSGHTERVSGFTFCPHPGLETTCASSSDDGTVKIWDTETRSVLKEHTAHQAIITALHWSPVDKELVVSADEKGVVICWWYSRNDVRHFLPETRHAFCLTCSPHCAEHVAVGYKDGMIIVMDINRKGEVIRRLRGHDGEIHTISWCPEPGEGAVQGRGEDVPGEDEEPTGEPGEGGSLLASGSRDQTVRVWSFTKGKAVITLKLPCVKRRGAGEAGVKERIWVAVHWPLGRPTQLVSSSFGGELLLWDLTKPGKQRWTLLGPTSEAQNHSRIVFNLSSARLAAGQDLLFSTSMDREVKCWDLETLDCLWTQPTLGGFVYCLAFSPVSTGCLAVGVGDGMIRVWNTVSLKNNYEVKTLWQGIKSKVTSLCWHPTREGCLAFGTEDGKVGIYDVYSNKPPQISSSYHRKTVYALVWGPPLHPVASGGGVEPASPSLYSCAGEGSILQHVPGKLGSDAHDINQLIRETNGIKHKLPSHSEVSWKPDGKVMAVGNEDGSVEILQAPSLQLLCTIQQHHKLINAVRWHHPHGSRQDLAFLIASASNNAIIYIHDLKTILENPPDAPVTLTEPYRTLSGHTAKITNLAWSPHHDGRLVSVCYDGTAQVWDVLSEEPVCNYRGHVGRLLSVQWSPVEPDVVWTGGDDFTVQQWGVSQQEHIRPPKGKKISELERKRPTFPKPRSKRNRKIVSERERDIPDTGSHRDWRERAQPPPERETATEPTSVANGTSSRDVSECPSPSPPATHLLSISSNQDPPPRRERQKEERKKEKPGGGAVGKRRKGGSVLPLSGSSDHRPKEELHQDCVNLASVLYSNGTEGPLPGAGEQIQLGLFVDRAGLYRMFAEEGQSHLDSGHPELHHQLLLWKGDIGGALQAAAQRGELSDSLLAMAPMAGYAVWVKTVEAYVKQLCFQEQYVLAATHLLSLQRVHQAVQLLSSHQLYREAIAIAKARLPPTDPVISELLGSWAASLEKDGHYSVAAKCYLTARCPYDAAKVLARKGDTASLRTAAEVARLAGEGDLSASLAQRCAQDLVSQRDWLTAQEVLQPQHSLLGQRLLLCTHELMYRRLEERDVLLWKSANPPRYHLWEAPASQGFLRSVQGVWRGEFGLDISRTDNLETLRKQLSTAECPPATPNTPPKQLLLVLAQEVCGALLSELMGDSSGTVTHMLSAVTRCVDTAHFTLMQEVNHLLLPEGPESVSGLRSRLNGCECEGAEALPSLEAFWCYGELYQLWWGLRPEPSRPSPAPSPPPPPAQESLDTGDRDLPLSDHNGDQLDRGTPDSPATLCGVPGLLSACSRLLSEDQARMQALGEQIVEIREAVSKLIRQHRESVRTEPGTGEAEEKEEEAGGETPCINGDVDAVGEREAQAGASSLGPSAPCDGDKEPKAEAPLTRLTQQLNEVNQQRAELSATVKSCRFPDVLECCLVLLHMSRCFPTAVPAELRERALSLARTYVARHGLALRRVLGES